jgi:CheY-like chemotaxis protein
LPLVDDDEDDRLFFTDAFADELKITVLKCPLTMVLNWMNYLNNEDSILPNVLFLDLNMPKKMAWNVC